MCKKDAFGLRCCATKIKWLSVPGWPSVCNPCESLLICSQSHWYEPYIRGWCVCDGCTPLGFSRPGSICAAGKLSIEREFLSANIFLKVPRYKCGYLFMQILSGWDVLAIGTATSSPLFSLSRSDRSVSCEVQLSSWVMRLSETNWTCSLVKDKFGLSSHLQRAK